MSRKLYLVRHAQSADKQSGQTDHDRALTPHGKSDAQALGKYFLESGYFFDFVLCSTALRTKQTLAQLHLSIPSLNKVEVHYSDILYHGMWRDYATILGKIQSDDQHVLLVGHNPSISDLASWMCHDFQSILPPAGFVKLNFDADHWSDVTYNSGKLADIQHQNSNA